MQHVKIENTDLVVSRLGFGTASLHHLYFRAERLKLLHSALSCGITHFDTSPYYGYGMAEYELGFFIRDRRDTVTIATKVGLYPPGGPAQNSFSVWLRKAAGKLYGRLSRPCIDWSICTAEHSLNESLKRLRTDYIDILFLHEPDPAVINSEEFLSWLEDQRRKGKIRYWGLAGEPGLLESWVQSDHPLALILQTRDSLESMDADFISRHGRRLQFTYGYLRSAQQRGVKDSADADEVLRNAMKKRNREGAILFSTRRASRIEQLARAVE